MSVSADVLREWIIALMIENAQIRAAVGPVIHSPFLDVDNLGVEFDAALNEINDIRANRKLVALEVDAGFKQSVLDSLLRRMESRGRVVFG